VDVVGGVGLLSGCERAPSPVRLLLGRDRLDPQVALEQHVEPQLPDAEEARGQHGVGDAAEREAEAALEMAQVVPGAVEDRERAGSGAERGEGARAWGGGGTRRADAGVGAPG